MKATNEFYWVLLLIISVLGLLGVIFLCIGAALYAKEKRKRASCTQQVIASVTDIQHRAIGASGYTDADEVKMMSWFPVYEYSVHGTVLRKRASVGTVRPEVSVGQKVNLYVNPNRPDEFYGGAHHAGDPHPAHVLPGFLSPEACARLENLVPVSETHSQFHTKVRFLS